MKNKNILFLTHTYTSFQKDQIESVAKYFNNVYVLVRYKPIAEISRILPLKGLYQHTKINTLDFKNTPANIRIIPVPVYYFPDHRGYLKMADRFVKKVVQIIKNERLKFDIVHAHYLWTSGYVAQKLKQIYQTPVVITNHSTYQLSKYPSKSSVFEHRIIETIQSADKIFVVNQFMKKKIQEFSVKAAVEVLPVGYSPSIFFPIPQIEARESLSLPPDDVIFLNISRLNKNKNLDLFIHGIHRLLPEWPNLKGLIIGEGHYQSRLKKTVNDLGCAENIKLIGQLAHHEVNQWINASDFITLTSFSEGSPTVMYEALACGKPFLGSRVGGIPEIILGEDYGLLFDPHNLDDLTQKMTQMLQIQWDSEKILKYGNQFSHENIADRYHQTYQNLINS